MTRYDFFIEEHKTSKEVIIDVLVMQELMYLRSQERKGGEERGGEERGGEEREGEKGEGRGKGREEGGGERKGEGRGKERGGKGVDERTVNKQTFTPIHEWS